MHEYMNIHALLIEQIVRAQYVYATHAETGSCIAEELVVSMEVDWIEGDTDHTRLSHYVPLKGTAGDRSRGLVWSHRRETFMVKT